MTNHEYTRLARFVESAEASYKKAAAKFSPFEGGSGSPGPSFSGNNSQTGAAPSPLKGASDTLLVAALVSLGLPRRTAERLAVETPAGDIEERIVEALKRRY